MPVSHLTSSRTKLLAALLNVLDEGPAASALTMSEAELLAAIRNTYGGSVSALTTSQAGLLASIETAAGGSGTALTDSIAQMLSGLLVARGGSGSHLTLSEGELLAGIANIPAEGGGEPAWLPPTALTFIGPKNGNYYFGGAEHTRAETVEQNSDWGTFDPAKIIADVGLRCTGTNVTVATNFVLTAAAASGLLPSAAGFTCVATYSNTITGTDGQCGITIEVLDLPDYNVEWSFTANRTADGETTNTLTSGSAATPIDDGGASHIAAVTCEPIHLAASIDGNSVVTVASPTDNTTATHIAVQVLVSLTDATATCVLESLVFYAPKLDAALPGLSTP